MPEPIKVGLRPWGAVRGFAGKTFVTVRGSQKEGDGAVQVLDGATARELCGGLDEPQGICFTGKLLIVADVKRLGRVDARGDRSPLVDEDDFPQPPGHLTGVALDPGGKAVYVADSEGGRVYRVGLDYKITVAVAEGAVRCPTGVTAPRAGHLLVPSSCGGAVFEVGGKTVPSLAEGLPGASSVEQDGQGTLFVSSADGGKVWRVARGKPAEVLVEAAAGQLTLDRRHNVLLVPDARAATVSELAMAQTPAPR